MRTSATLFLLSALLPSGVAAGVLSLADPQSLSEESTAHLCVQAFAADDPVSLHDLFNKWQGSFHPKEGANLAIDDIRTDIGISLKSWGYLGYTYRHHSIVETNRDTVLLAWQQLNDIGFTTGKRYALDISIEGFEADGVLYAKSFEVFKREKGSLSVGFGIELLRGRNIQDGYLNGSAVANSEKDYDFSAVADYRYSENYLYNLNVKKPDGYGYTTHLSLRYRYGDFRLNLLVNDLYGKIVWKDLPYSYVNVNSSNKSYDDNGYVIYNPTISGVEKYIDYTQRLYTKYRAEGSYSLSAQTMLTAGVDAAKERVFPYIAAAHSFTRHLEASLSYESRFGMFGIDLRYKALRLALKSDGIDHPSALALTLSCILRF